MVSESGWRGGSRRSWSGRGLVLGCGGTLGATWMVAALAEVERALGWDVRTANVIVGTSSGSEIAALLGAGVSAEALFDAHLAVGDASTPLRRRFGAPPRSFPPLPRWALGSPALARRAVSAPTLLHLGAILPEGRGDASFVARVLDETLAPNARWVPHPATWIMTVDFDSGERAAFGSPGAPEADVRDAVRASWAVPGWFPPVTIGGRRYADGGLVSPGSPHLLAPLHLDEVVVIAPMSSHGIGRGTGLSRLERRLRAVMRRTLDREIALLRKAGTRVALVEPQEEDLAVMGGNFMDGSRRLAVLESSLRTCRPTVARALEAFTKPRASASLDLGALS